MFLEEMSKQRERLGEGFQRMTDVDSMTSNLQIVMGHAFRRAISCSVECSLSFLLRTNADK